MQGRLEPGAQIADCRNIHLALFEPQQHRGQKTIKRRLRSQKFQEHTSASRDYKEDHENE